MSFKSSSYLNTNAAVVNTTDSFPRISSGASRHTHTLKTSRSEKSTNSRIRSIILSNKKSLNNAVDSISKPPVPQPEQSSETFTSFSKMPQIESSVMYTLSNRGSYGAGTDSMLIKSPFKQSSQAKQQAPIKGTFNQTGTARLVSAKTIQSCQLRPINVN